MSGKASHIAYPLHGLWHMGDGNVKIINCEKTMILPLQVPVRGASSSELYCIGCGKLVDATAAQVAQAKAAASADGFVEPESVPPTPVLPGTLSATGRAALYWHTRIVDVKLGCTKADAEKAICAGEGELRALGLLDEGVPVRLNQKGRELSALIVSPPVDNRLARTDDPSLAPAKRTKRPSRKALIADKIPRCATVACFSPLDRDGKCTGNCGYEERRAARLAEVRRMWDAVDERAPVKAKRQRKTKVAAGEGADAAA